MGTLLDPESESAAPEDFVEVARRRLEDGAELELRAGNDVFHLQGEPAEAILAVLSALTSGRQLSISSLPSVMTTGQAADLLGVSRPTVVSLVDRGAIPATRVGTHRRIETVHLIEYMGRSRQASEAAMDELVRASEELGLYDE